MIAVVAEGFFYVSSFSSMESLEFCEQEISADFNLEQETAAFLARRGILLRNHPVRVACRLAAAENPKAGHDRHR